jgi:hypothetical protein
MKIAGNRSEESHFVGGVVLNAADDSARFSHDFDIFHELAEEVARASNRDVESLRRFRRRAPPTRRAPIIPSRGSSQTCMSEPSRDRLA